MIFITLYIIILIWKFKYNEYKINSNINYIINLNKDIENKIKNTNELIEYKTSKAFKNKILKEEQSLKNKWEKVIYLTNEDKYNTYTRNIEDYKKDIEKTIEEKELNIETDEMNIYQKWIYFLLKKETK